MEEIKLFQCANLFNDILAVHSDKIPANTNAIEICNLMLFHVVKKRFIGAITSVGERKILINDAFESACVHAIVIRYISILPERIAQMH